MFARGKKSPRPLVEESLDVPGSLAKLYEQNLKPLEEYINFSEFHSSVLDTSHFAARPMVLLIGQYSTGKTTFLNHIIESDFPGMRIGPEPTTDGFMVIEHGEKDDLLPGNAIVHDQEKPYGPLSQFGVNFLNTFQSSSTNSEILKHMTFIDTPGILTGYKQERGYNFPGVLKWFAERVDRVLIIFDAHKLDISNEMSDAIKALSGHENKIRLILNKADSLNALELMNVYGALLWRLATIYRTPELPRVFMGSFWNRNLKNDSNRRLFEMQKVALLEDLMLVPRDYLVRLLSDTTKRCRVAITHAHIMHAIRMEWGLLSGEKKKTKIINDLDRMYSGTSDTLKIPLGDFPNISEMKKNLRTFNFNKAPKLNKNLVHAAENMLKNDIPPLMKKIKTENEKQNGVNDFFSLRKNVDTPFHEKFNTGINHGETEDGWVVDKNRDKWLDDFYKCRLVNGKVNDVSSRECFIKSKLPNAVLGKVWSLSDVDRDGFLDENEFCLAMYLIEKIADEGHQLPDVLPPHLVPPDKRSCVSMPAVRTRPSRDSGKGSTRFSAENQQIIGAQASDTSSDVHHNYSTNSPSSLKQERSSYSTHPGYHSYQELPLTVPLAQHGSLQPARHSYQDVSPAIAPESSPDLQEQAAPESSPDLQEHA